MQQAKLVVDDAAGAITRSRQRMREYAAARAGAAKTMMTSGMTAGLHAGRDLEDHSKRVLAEKVLPLWLADPSPGCPRERNGKQTSKKSVGRPGQRLRAGRRSDAHGAVGG